MVAQSSYGHSVADDVRTDPLLRRGGSGSRGLAPAQPGNSYVRRAPGSSGLYDVLDLILDKGIVVDAFVRVSLVGIELITVDLRVVIASVDTYLRYAEGAERLKLYEPRGGESQLPDMMGMNEGVGGMMLKQGKKKLKNAVGAGDKGKGEEGVGERLAHGVRNVLTHGVGRIMERVSGDDSDRDGGNSKERGGRRDESSKRDRAGARGR